MSVTVWATRLERPLTEKEAAALLRLLPVQRRERLLRGKQPERRREPLCAYFMLRCAVLERYRWAELPEIAIESTGKPWFPDHPEVCFNLSHTGGAVLTGVADGPVGVDIERMRRVKPQMMRRLQAETEEEFFRRWVRLEARSKRSGAGVAAMLDGEPPPQPGEFYQELELFPGYAAGVAAGAQEHLEQIRVYSLDELMKFVPQSECD